MRNLMHSQELADDILKIGIEIVNEPFHIYLLPHGLDASILDKRGVVVDAYACCEGAGEAG
jgi:hypothetical protein